MVARLFSASGAPGMKVSQKGMGFFDILDIGSGAHCGIAAEPTPRRFPIITRKITSLPTGKRGPQGHQM